MVQIEERKRAIEADYAAIADVAPSLPSICSVEEFKWARMCVCSRNFGLEVNRIRTAALVPYAGSPPPLLSPVASSLCPLPKAWEECLNLSRILMYIYISLPF